MVPETFAEPDDDPAFLACVDRLIAGLVESVAPDEVYLVRIVNWFDHKWLGYSGIGRVPFYGVRIHTALDTFYQQQVTFPPFTPNRVATQHYFCRTTRGHFEEQAPAYLIHRRGRDHSATNLQRRVADFSHSALMVWFSSHSAANQRGTLMVYTVHSGNVGAWYASFVREAAWRLAQVKGIRKCDVESLLAGLSQPTRGDDAPVILP